MVVSCALRQKTKKVLKDVPPYVRNEVQSAVSLWVGLPREELEIRLLKMILPPTSSQELKEALSLRSIESISKVCPDFNIKFANEVRSQRQGFGFEEGFMEVKVPYSPAPEYEAFSKQFDSNLILKYSIANAIFTYSSALSKEKFERFLYLTSQTEEKYIFGGLREAGFPDALSKLFWPYAGKFNRFLVEFRKYTLSNEKTVNVPVAPVLMAKSIEEPKEVKEDAKITEETEVAKKAPGSFDIPKDVEPEVSEIVEEPKPAVENSNAEAVSSCSESNVLREDASEIVQELSEQQEDKMHIVPKITPRVVLKNEAIFYEFYECLLKLIDLRDKKDTMAKEFTHSDFQALSTAYTDLNCALNELSTFGFNAEDVWNKRLAIVSLFNSLKEFH